MKLIITDGGYRYWDERIGGWTMVRENATRYGSIYDCPACLENSDEETYYGNWWDASQECVTYTDDNGREAWTTEA